ncbi:NERD domain-containing protein [Candidatus Peregrinibacteria bacterium]|nr:NERD domain-containing protein [Candidatus Peregrinibacteria bacterium]
MNYTKQIIAKNVAKSIGIFLVSGIMFYFGVKYTANGIKAGKWTNAYILQMMLMTAGLILGILLVKMNTWFERFSDKILDSIEYALIGNSGEKQVKAELDKFLDINEYKIYRNIVLPKRKFDIDIIVLGPKGLTIFEVKKWKDKVIFYENEKYFEKIKQKSEYKTEITKWYKRDPREKLGWSCNNLKKYLEEMGINTTNLPIHKSLVFPNAVAEWKGSPGVFIISGLEGLKKYFVDDNRKKISTDDYIKLKEIFDTLIK